MTNWAPASRSSNFVNHSYDYRANWTLLCPITIINHNHYKFLNCYWCIRRFSFHESFSTLVIGQCNLTVGCNPTPVIGKMKHLIILLFKSNNHRIDHNNHSNNHLSKEKLGNFQNGYLYTRMYEGVCCVRHYVVFKTPIVHDCVMTLTKSFWAKKARYSFLQMHAFCKWNIRLRQFFTSRPHWKISMRSSWRMILDSRS